MGRTTLIHGVRVAVWVLVIWLAAQSPWTSNASWVPARSSREMTLEPGESARSPFRATTDRQKMALSSYTCQPLRFEANAGPGFTFSSAGMSYSLVLAPGEAILQSNGLQRSDLGLLGRKSDGSSAVPEHPQSQVRTNLSSVLRMKLVGASVSARILGARSASSQEQLLHRQRSSEVADRGSYATHFRSECDHFLRGGLSIGSASKVIVCGGARIRAATDTQRRSRDCQSRTSNRRVSRSGITCLSPLRRPRKIRSLQLAIPTPPLLMKSRAAVQPGDAPTRHDKALLRIGDHPAS